MSRAGNDVSIGVQSILYLNGFDAIERAAGSLARSAELAVRDGYCGKVYLFMGDCSPDRVINDEQLEQLRSQYGAAIDIRYEFFGANLGSAAGHNRLALKNSADYFLIRNPDVVVAPSVISIFLETLRDPTVGMVEAKQLPIEHPKEYDLGTGETSWAATACALIPAELFRQIDGFDADSFFLYCDDVDFSWRVRLAGKKVIFQPAAVCFHDKRLNLDGHWDATTAERYYSMEASLMLAHKWSRPDLVDRYLKVFGRSDDENCKKARATYLRKKADGKLPTPVDANHAVGSFVGYNYANHRFML